jgi:hypothetical protein
MMENKIHLVREVKSIPKNKKSILSRNPFIYFSFLIYKVTTICLSSISWLLLYWALYSANPWSISAVVL